MPGSRARAYVERLAASECPALTTRRARREEQTGAPHDPPVWTRAAGCHVWDVDDNRFVDLSAGFGAAAVGHAHPKVVAAIQAQAARLMHALGDLQPSDVKVDLLERLAGLVPLPNARVILGLQGSDAVEAALKTAVLCTGKPGVLAFTGGYHGLAHGPLALCGYRAAFRTPFSNQLNPHVCFAPYPGLESGRAETLAGALASIASAWDAAGSPIGAVVVEPVLGRGGVVLPPPGFLRELGALCRARGALLIADEIMTGLGRTGHLLLSIAMGAEPDIVCLGKALGGGQPVSACVGRGDVMAAWGDPGGEALHTGTFLGNPVGCAAALAALRVLTDEDLATRALRVGERWQGELQTLTARHTSIEAVRGIGLLQGIVLSSPGQALSVVQGLLRRGYITVPAGADTRVLSLTPPLTIPEPLLEGFLPALDDTLSEHAT